MVDEMAEVRKYLSGQQLERQENLYRACYMVAKYYKQLGCDEETIFHNTAEWARTYNLTLSFSLAGCVAAAYMNDRALRDGNVVRISRQDADTIRMYARNKPGRRVALALLCCAKGYAASDGSFVASSGALSSWLGMDACNVRGRYIPRLVQTGYLEKLPTQETLHGWQKNYYRNACRLRLKVPYVDDGEWELRNNDIRTLYEQVFDEPF